VAIVEEINFEGNAEDALLSAASAADELAASADAARDALGEVDAGEVDTVSDSAGDASAKVASIGDAAGDASAGLGKMGDEGGSTLQDIATLATGVGAALEIAEKAMRAAKAIGQVAMAFGEAISGAKVFHDETVAALDQLTGGRGEAALDGLAAKAVGLGISTESAVEQFTALREAGASNMDASALIALRADLEAVGVSGDKADEAVKKALSEIKGGKDASKAISDVAKSFGAVGDGANAAAKRSLTWAGALKNIEGLGGRIFGTVAEIAGPALDKVGAKITEVLDAFEGSGTVESFGEAIASALEYVPPIIDGIVEAWFSFADAAGPAVEGLVDAFSELGTALGESGEGMNIASMIGTALGVVIGGMATGIRVTVAAATALVEGLTALGGAAAAAYDAVSSGLGAIADISLADAGMALMEGFVDGIMSMAAAVAEAAANVAGAAADAVAGALGIASPSKVGLALGANLGESVGSGAEEAMPPTIDVPSFGAPANDVGDVIGDVPVAGAQMGGGPSIVFEAGSIVIAGSGSGGSVTMADVEQAVRRGVELALERKAS
jgi:hypothetical protein